MNSKIHSFHRKVTKVQSKFLRQVFDIIKNPLIYFFIFLLNKGVVPDKLKLARVCLIFKNGEKDKLTNYKLASVLAFISKIPERIMYNRLYHCCDENGSLFKKHFIFRDRHSTYHAILELTHDFYGIK